MIGLWIGLGVIGAGYVWLLRNLHRFPLMSEDYDAEPEPEWGCDGCQDEAEEIAALEAIWAIS